MVKSKQKREHVAWRDEIQAKFNPTGTAEIRRKPVTIIEEKYKTDDKFACPFCLSQHKFHEYLISTKKGIHQGLAECPECKNKCRFTTLTKPFTPEEYADHLYAQVRTGIWQKIPFDKWKRRLYNIGWASRFWTRYKELKAQEIDETPIDKEQEKQIEMDWDAYEQSHGGK